MNNIFETIKYAERQHFRTVHDTGANSNALIVMNSIRVHLGLPTISKDDLPAWDEKRKGYFMPTHSRLLIAAEVILETGGRV